MFAAGALAALLSLTACGSESPTTPPIQTQTSCPGVDFGPKPAALSLPQTTPATMQLLGGGLDTVRYQAEISVRGATAYTSTWSAQFRHAPGNAINIWDVSGAAPALVDSTIVSGPITNIGDVAVSDDGKLLVVATEYAPGSSITIYDLTDPRHPQFLSRFANDQTAPGVHTAEIGRVNGKLYAFLAVDPGGSVPAKLVIVDLSTPTAPKQVYVKTAGSPFVHDTFLRDGLLFVALWNDGMQIWDLGGCGTGASPENPRVLGTVRTVNGDAHNVWWYHDANGSKHFAFVGEEGPGTVGSTSRGDIHVVDVSDPSAPKEVAFYHVDGAGTHNFSVDEANGILYAAYYNGGVRALDIRGDLGTCPASATVGTSDPPLVRCDLRLMGRELAIGLSDGPRPVYVWGVQYLNGNVYASDMLNGIWKLRAAR